MAADADVVRFDRREPTFDRMLMRLGVRDDVARIITATPSLRASWLLAALGAALFAAWGDQADPRVLSVVLILAPVLPVAGVAAAYGPWADPMYESTLSTPTSGLRVLLLRSVAVLLAAAALVSVAVIALPDAGPTAVAWVLPALALCSSSLMLATFLPLNRAAALVTGAWLAISVGVSVSARALHGGDPYEDLGDDPLLGTLSLGLQDRTITPWWASEARSCYRVCDPASAPATRRSIRRNGSSSSHADGCPPTTS